MPNVVIIGAGIAGSTLALLLKRFTNLTPRIYERAHSFEHIGAGFSLAPNALNSLSRMGLMDKLHKIAQPVSRINCYDRVSRRNLSVLSNHWYQDLYGCPLMTFERASLQDLLVGELRDAGVEVEFGKEFSSVEAEGDVHENALVRFSDGSMVEGDLIVGADGGWSTLRHSMGVQADTGAQDDAFGGVMYSGWVIVYGISEPIEGLPEDETIVLADRALSYGAWPLQNKQKFWFLCVPEPYPGRSPSAFDMQPTLARYPDLYFPVGGSSGVGSFHTDIIKRSIRSVKVPLMTGAFEKTVNNRLVLIGDAAHNLVPFFGQGAGQAIEDAVSLCNHLRSITNYVSSPSIPSPTETIPLSSLLPALLAHSAVRAPRVERVVKESVRVGKFWLETPLWLLKPALRAIGWLPAKTVGKGVSWLLKEGVYPAVSAGGHGQKGAI